MRSEYSMGLPAGPALRPMREDTVGLADAATVVRELVVKPAMCGPNARLVAQIGDWTWDTVSRLCGVDAFCASDAQGVPTYLSFYYYELSGDAGFHLRTPTFGDRLQVVSTCYGFGAESILTLHRLAPLERGLPPTLTAQELHEQRHAGCLYVRTFNRWIQRGEAGNRDLQSAAPHGFQHQHLPQAPAQYSPRLAYDGARRQGGFTPAGVLPREACTLDYEVDMGRDLNGVGLLYFASYFDIIDSALARMWRRMGRTDSSFLARLLARQRVVFLGNTDAGAALSIELQRWVDAGDAAHEMFTVRVLERDTGRLLAIAELS
ncbi:LnmK family bifunctional acyltransferase/decarboxylase [Pseudoduganella buxea]|nr:LnmK family bifunctional acyltransferase/decarboxylase [Pseudoduganella buxea]